MTHLKKILQAGVLCSLAISFSAAPAFAQRGQFRDSQPPPRTNSQFLKAFHDSTIEAAQSTVRILCDDKETALGTVVGCRWLDSDQV